MPTISPLKETNPFESFFRDELYLDFKSDLYNYRVRRQAIQKVLREFPGERIFEVGPGVSPTTDPRKGTIYSDLSYEALRVLKHLDSNASYVVSSVTEIPFRSESASVVVCSEVLEHVADDDKALAEMHRVVSRGGHLILTVPIHSYYYTFDDQFVGHQRRYELRDLMKQLERIGYEDIQWVKVAGLLEKLTTLVVVWVFCVLSRVRKSDRQFSPVLLRSIFPFYRVFNRFYSFLIRLDAKLTPLFMTSILLVSCRRKR